MKLRTRVIQLFNPLLSQIILTDSPVLLDDSFDIYTYIIDFTLEQKSAVI